MFKELSDEIQNLVSKSEFMSQAAEIQFIKKDVAKFIVEDEVMNRFYSFNTDTNVKLENKIGKE